MPTRSLQRLLPAPETGPSSQPRHHGHQARARAERGGGGRVHRPGDEGVRQAGPGGGDPHGQGGAGRGQAPGREAGG